MNNEIPRTPLVERISDEIAQAVDPTGALTLDSKKRTVMSAAAIANVFTGATIPNGTNLNTWKKPGVYRFDQSVVNGPPTSAENMIGYLVVVAGHRDPLTGEEDVDRVRQVAYPDTVVEPTPYTRVCEGGQNWSPWNTLGGNLRRVRLTKNLTGQINVMYYSFENWTLTLPPASSYPLGTRIGLEQYAGAGKVINDTDEIQTGPDFDIDEDGNPTSDIIGALIYLFEICEMEDGTKAWVQDTDNNIDRVIDSIQQMFTDHITDPDPHQMYIMKTSISHEYTHTTADATKAMGQVLSRYGSNAFYNLVVKYSELAARGLYPNAHSVSNGNFNTMITQGLYFTIGASVTNGPSDVDGQGHVFVIAVGTWVAQIYLHFSSGDMYYRVSTNTGTSWTTWKRTINQAELRARGIYPTAVAMHSGSANLLLLHGMYNIEIDAANASSSPTGAAWTGTIHVIRSILAATQIAVSREANGGMWIRYTDDATVSTAWKPWTQMATVALVNTKEPGRNKSIYSTSTTVAAATLLTTLNTRMWPHLYFTAGAFSSTVTLPAPPAHGDKIFVKIEANHSVRLIFGSYDQTFRHTKSDQIMELEFEASNGKWYLLTVGDLTLA